MCFVKILFHLLEVAVSIDFAREKKMFLTGFTHRKAGLWKSCELDLLFESHVNCLSIEKIVLEIVCNSTEKHGCSVLRGSRCSSWQILR
jgi:hypothetical protein